MHCLVQYAQIKRNLWKQEKLGVQEKELTQRLLVCFLMYINGNIVIYMYLFFPLPNLFIVLPLEKKKKEEEINERKC